MSLYLFAVKETPHLFSQLDKTLMNNPFEIIAIVSVLVGAVAALIKIVGAILDRQSRRLDALIAARIGELECRVAELEGKVRELEAKKNELSDLLDKERALRASCAKEAAELRLTLLKKDASIEALENVLRILKVVQPEEVKTDA